MMDMRHFISPGLQNFKLKSSTSFLPTVLMLIATLVFISRQHIFFAELIEDRVATHLIGIRDVNCAV